MSLSLPQISIKLVLTDLTLEDFENASLEGNTTYDAKKGDAEIVWQERTTTERVEVQARSSFLGLRTVMKTVDQTVKSKNLCIIIPHGAADAILTKMQHHTFPDRALVKVNNTINFLMRVQSHINFLIQERTNEPTTLLSREFVVTRLLHDNQQYIERLIKEEKRLFNFLTQSLVAQNISGDLQSSIELARTGDLSIE